VAARHLPATSGGSAAQDSFGSANGPRRWAIAATQGFTALPWWRATCTAGMGRADALARLCVFCVLTLLMAAVPSRGENNETRRQQGNLATCRLLAH